ncbi:MAG: TonB-dependent receptor [Burkholderiales bacterium]|nr:TonB-dependent receptor [Burkholderiales bacterium]
MNWHDCMRRGAITAAAMSLGVSAVLAADAAAKSVADLSLEELMNIQVVSGAKKLQRIADSASAVFVITGEDIRRSGVTSIPEALRMAPGVEVARFGSNKWAVSIRGSNGRFANKLLVLMDGRTLYSPLFAGVLWEQHDVLMEDVERIEVIRGPGAALWGANAVNGVINIITRHARDTKGGLASAGAGNVERGFGSARYGAGAGEDGAYRIFAKGFARDRSPDPAGGAGADDWNAGLAGFRYDKGFGNGDQLLVEGSVFSGRVGDKLTSPDLMPPYQSAGDIEQRNRGAHILARWEGGQGLVVQGFFDRQELRLGRLHEVRNSADLEVQRRVAFGSAHDVVFGMGYRVSQDETTTFIDTFYLQPAERTTRLLSAFAQDEITLVPERLRLTLGARAEHNSYTGFELQPNVRLLWTPSASQSVWASAARAVRTPARFEADGRMPVQVIAPFTPANPGPLPAGVSLAGNRTIEAERLRAFEIGYRNQLAPGASFDVSIFRHTYDGLRTFVAGAPQPQLFIFPPFVLMPLDAANRGDGRVRGIEVSAEYRLADWWRLSGFASRQRLDFHDQGATDTRTNGSSPRSTYSLRSAMNLAPNLELDLWLRHVGSLSALNVDSYTSLDARVGWKLARNLELSLTGQNLLEHRHQEFVSDFFGSATYVVPRGAYVKLDWKF